MELVVRAKSSHRKKRSAEPVRAQLEPMQDRSRLRNELILNAACKLLETVDIENLSHSDIAAVAGISKPGVHYHFPTIASVQLALGRKFDAELSQFMAAAGIGKGETDWQALMSAWATVARDWYNDRRPACEAMLGPMLNRDVRRAGIEYNKLVGAGMLSVLRRSFLIPDGSHLVDAIAYNGDIMDMFWSKSYLTLGTITDEALEQSLVASLAYLNNFIPRYLPRNDKPRRPASELETAASEDGISE